MELKLGKKATNKLDEEDTDLDIEDMNWLERPNSALFSISGDFKCQNPKDL